MVEIIKDWSTLKKLIFLKATGAAGAVWRTVSGAIVSFIVQHVRPLKALAVDLEPIQAGSGDPSPDNVRPISGRTGATVYHTGKNILNPEIYGRSMPFTSNDITFTKVSDGVYHASGTATANVYYNLTFTSNPESAMSCAPFIGLPVYLSVFGTEKLIPNLGYFKSDGSFTNLRNGAILPNDAVGFRLYLRLDNGVTIDTDFSVQLEISKTPTDYEPYTGTTYPVSWETEAGTVYGAELDVVSGVLTVTHKMVDGGTLRWTYWVNDSFYAAVDDKFSTRIKDTISSCYPSIDGSTASTFGIYVRLSDITARNIYIADTQYSHDAAGAAQLKNDMTGQQIVYPLATPLTYQLTAQQIQTLLGDNTVWSDAGDVTVTYSE